MDEGMMLQQALMSGGSQPQNTQQVAPVQEEVMMAPEDTGEITAQMIQEQLDLVMQALDQVQDPQELTQLAGIARELQLALEAALQQGLGPDQFGPMDTAEDEMGIENY